MLVFDFQNINLLIENIDFLKLNSVIISDITSNVSEGGIFIPPIKTTNFGIKSLRKIYGIIILKIMKTATLAKLEYF